MGNKKVDLDIYEAKGKFFIYLDGHRVYGEDPTAHGAELVLESTILKKDICDSCGLMDKRV